MFSCTKSVRMLLLLTSKMADSRNNKTINRLRVNGFKLDDDNKVTDGEKVYCFHLSQLKYIAVILVAFNN